MVLTFALSFGVLGIVVFEDFSDAIFFDVFGEEPFILNRSGPFGETSFVPEKICNRYLVFAVFGELGPIFADGLIVIEMSLINHFGHQDRSDNLSSAEKDLQ